MKKKKIACKSLIGLLPATNNSIKCILKAENIPKLIITNYQRVSKLQFISLLIPNFLNPNGNWDLIIKCVYEKNRLYTILAESTLNLSTNILLPNGLDSDLLDDGNTFYTINNKKLNDYFDVSFLITDSTPIDKDSKIIVELPTFDIGFLVNESYLVCNIMGIYFECHHFPGIDWIYIVINKNLVPIANKTIISIKNLKWPRYRIDGFPVNKNIFRFIDKNSQITKIMLYPYFARSDKGDLEYVDIRIDKRERSNVDVKYMLKIKSFNDIPEKSQIIIKFPSIYNLWAPFPSIKIESPEIEKLSNNTQTYTFTENTIVIDDTPFLSRNIVFRIMVSGVRNPDTSAPLDSWEVLIKKDNNEIAEKKNFMSFYLMSKFIPKRVEINHIACFPTNKLLLSTYTFIFSFQTKLRKKSEIYIEFPSNYTALPNYFDCLISGSINTFNSCKRKANKFIIELDSVYISGDIKVIIDNIKNPNLDKSGVFNIYTKYDSKIVDETKLDSKPKRILSFSEKPAFFYLKEFNFDPITEAQSSNYYFSAKPSNNIEKGEEILVNFPRLFDQNVGRKITLQILTGLEGEIKLRIKNRRIYIYGFTEYKVGNEFIKFIIKGVNNPNKPENGDAGYISIGIIKENKSEYKEYLENAGIIALKKTPKPLEVIFFNSSNLFSRLNTTLTLILNLEELFEFNNNIFFLDLPEEFEEAESINELNCYINNIESKCSQLNKRITIEELNKNLINNVEIKIENILNPLDEIVSSYFKISVYNKLIKTIFYQTYNNLNNLFLEYKYPGPLLVVNNNEPVYIEKGSHSKFLNLRITEICALNLKISGHLNMINLNPLIIDFPIGEINKKFRISVPMEINEEELFFYWKILGDFDMPIYTPIKKTKIFITEKKNIPILIEEINDIPLLGTSLGIAIKTSFAPSTGIEIRLNFKTNHDYIKLNTTEVIFDSGKNINYFEISSLSNSLTNLISGEIILELKGVNKDIYELEKNKLKFKIINFDDKKPEILDLKLVEISQVNVKIFLSVNEIVTVYYYNALRHSSPPLFEDIKNQNFENLVTTEGQFGILHIGNDLNSEIFIENLSAETEYVFYVYLIDRGRNFVEIPAVLEYKTNNKFNSALVEIGFLQSYINQAEKKLVFEYLAFLMSLKKEKIEETKYQFDFIKNDNVIEDDEGLSSQKIQSILKFNVIAEHKSGIYPSPLDLSKILTTKKDKIKENFNNFDLNFQIKSKEFIRYIPNFASKPSIKIFDHNSINLLSKLDNFGWIYAVLIKKNEDLGKPSSYQISKGYNHLNIPKNFGFIEISLKFELFEFYIDGLEADTNYNIYITCGSAHPGYPDLIDNDFIQELDFKTLSTPEIPKLSLEFEFIFFVTIYAFFVFI